MFYLVNRYLEDKYESTIAIFRNRISAENFIINWQMEQPYFDNEFLEIEAKDAILSK